MNAIQQITTALAATAVCLIINYAIKDWRAIVQDLGYFLKKDGSKTGQDA